MHEIASKMHKKLLAAGAPPENLLGELTLLLISRSNLGRGYSPSILMPSTVTCGTLKHHRYKRGAAAAS